MVKVLLLFLVILLSCTPKISLKGNIQQEITGSEFYRIAKDLDGNQFDSLARLHVLSGHMPAFMYALVPVKLSIRHKGKLIKATLFVTKDYISIGKNTDWARVPLTPMSAQEIADSFHCFLPTTKITDEIYRQAKIKLAPIPLTKNRESLQTMYEHHLLIQKQYGGEPGLIAGIKKDLVISEKLNDKPGKVAIYGWHKLDGIPIQPLYTGHIRSYVDYSHGVRLVYQDIKINGKWKNYKQVLSDSILSKLITYEPANSFTKYIY